MEPPDFCHVYSFKNFSIFIWTVLFCYTLSVFPLVLGQNVTQVSCKCGIFYFLGLFACKFTILFCVLVADSCFFTMGKPRRHPSLERPKNEWMDACNIVKPFFQRESLSLLYCKNLFLGLLFLFCLSKITDLPFNLFVVK